MKIQCTVSNENVMFYAEPSDSDVVFWEGRKAKMGQSEARFFLPQNDGFSLHPDALALAALLVYGPFAARKIEFDWSVSREFAEQVKIYFKREISPVDLNILPRAKNSNGRDSLAFSGGVDSVAALAVLPDNTLPIFMNRVIPKGFKKGLYSNEAALRSCETLRVSGREVIVFDTTMEYARDPVGFSVDWTNAAGAVLLADLFDLRSVSFGMVAESAFFLGHSHYSDLKTRSVYAAWAPLFESIGLPIALPTSGISEVVTAKIANDVASKWYSQSCVRGTVDEPCGKCFKCFRKTILDAKVSNKVLSSTHFDVALQSKEIKRRLLETPIHHEVVLSYSLHGLKCDGDHPIFSILKDKTAAIQRKTGGVGFIDKYYSRCFYYIPEFLHDCVKTNLSRYALEATEEDVLTIEGWNISNITKLEDYILAQQKLEKRLAN